MTYTPHRRILVIKLGALGDIVLSLGPFAAIRKNHSEAHITLLTTPSFKEFLGSSGYFDEVWTDIRPTVWQVTEWLKLRSRLRGGQFTKVYDLQTSDRSGWYFRLFGRTGRPEWSGVVRGCSNPHSNPRRDLMHSIERQEEQLALAGIHSVPVADLSWANGDISRFGLRDDFVLIIPGGASHRPDKRWPVKYYAEIASRVIANGFQPVVIGTKSEIGLGQEIEAKCPKGISLCGQTELNDLATLARHAICAVGNDTGPIHLVAAAGCRTVVLFSAASDPALTAPRGPSIQILDQENLANLSLESVAAALRLV